MKLTEGYVRSGNLHLWGATLPGSRVARSLCGKEAPRGSLELASWSNRARRRCPECVATAALLVANRVRLEVLG